MFTRVTETAGALLQLYNRTYGRQASISTADHTDPNELGYCYLHLVRPAHYAKVSACLGALARRSAVEDLLLDQPDIANEGAFFLVTISRPQGLKAGHYVVHIEPSPQSESAMQWREVLSVAPFGSVFGAKGTDDLRVSDMPSAIPNPHVRRFYFKGSQIGFGTNLARLNNISSNTSVVAFTKFFPIVTATKLVAHIHPFAKASHALTSFGTCWVSSDPGNRAGAMEEQTYETHTVGPSGAGGAVAPFSITCPFDAVVSPQLKPEPRFGDFPQFYIIWDCTQLGSEALNAYTAGPPAVESDKLFQVYFELILDANPAQSIA